MSNKICSVKGCGREYYAKGLCSRHYQRKTKELADEVKILPNESWKDVVGYEGLYQVSNLGRVKSLPHIRRRRYRTGEIYPYRVSGKLLTPQHSVGGYLQVILQNGPDKKVQKVHRLVCQAFHGNSPKDRNEVNHIDGNKKNNSSENLEWCSREENCRHARRVLKSCLKKVMCVETGKIFECMTDADNEYGLSSGAVSKVIRGERETAGGVHWKKVI